MSSVLGKKGNRVGRRFILSLLFLLRFAWVAGEGKRVHREYSCVFLYACVWEPEDNFWESVLFFPDVGPGD